jgi:cobalt-zinc-cadmium efflux system outer membrane protein
MSPRRSLLLAGALLLSGCLYHAREHADQAVCDLAAKPFDLCPSAPPEPAKPAAASAVAPLTTDVRTAAYMEAVPDAGKAAEIKAKLTLPDAIPGSEAPPIRIPEEKEAKEQAIRELYPELPALPTAPAPLPGPEGQAYTLAQLQQIAAANSPTLRQAAADVETARGNLIQAAAYPNPNVGYSAAPSSDGTTPGTQGVVVSQTIKTGGKLKLQAAAAQVALTNAELALKKARSDLATQVRNAYFSVLIGKETVRVNAALARFTDDVYRTQAELLKGGFAGPYEPAALRAQAYTARLALQQSIATYLYNWKSLVAIIGLRQLPLSEVAGRIDSMVPAYDYDAVLAHVIHNHTAVLTAHNGIDAARYNLKLAQILPAVPDVNVQATLAKDFAVPPFGISPSVQVTVPIPVFDQNKGNILAAEGTLLRASEEPHRVETMLTNNLANAYTNYRNNLDGLEYYRKHILPDQVRFYRGVYARRGVDANVQFADLVTAQQTLAQNVASYLTILNQLWTSVVAVADFLETDDLFQCSHPEELPPILDLSTPPDWPCCHPCVNHGACSCAAAAIIPAAVEAAPKQAPVSLPPAVTTPN